MSVRGWRGEINVYMVVDRVASGGQGGKWWTGRQSVDRVNRVAKGGQKEAMYGK